MPNERTDVIQRIAPKQERHYSPSIPEPQADTKSLYLCMMAVKEAIEVLANLRGRPMDATVTYRDLIALGLMDKEQLPKDGGPPRIV